MIIKSYEFRKNITNLLKNNFFLFYGENFGLKKDLKDFVFNEIKHNNDIENLSFFENDILNNVENFYNSIYSGSLFSNKKIITINEASDKIINLVSDIFEKYNENVILIFFSQILEKKSKLRIFFEKNKKTVCVPCYLDSQRDLEFIAQEELKKNNLSLSREIINLLIEKSNFDRNNLRNEVEKIISYSFNKKKIEIDNIKYLINFSGDYKSDIFVNECLCGNITAYKKIISELYIGAVNQILLFRILANKIQCLLKIKEQENDSKNLDYLIDNFRPPIFWKEKPMVKKQLSIWKSKDLEKVVKEINATELLCKKNPQVANSIFFNFFSEVCFKASNFS
tara:strand:- start:813 stop:1829 length:1017 start_codon:yes stop_codon:yes gene_type:complete